MRTKFKIVTRDKMSMSTIFTFPCTANVLPIDSILECELILCLLLELWLRGNAMGIFKGQLAENTVQIFPRGEGGVRSFMCGKCTGWPVWHWISPLNVDLCRVRLSKECVFCERVKRSQKQVTVLSRSVRSLFGPTRKSSPWGNFSDGGLNQSIKRRLSLQTLNLIDWLIDDIRLWLDWFIGFVPHDLLLRGRGWSDRTRRDNTVLDRRSIDSIDPRIALCMQWALSETDGSQCVWPRINYPIACHCIRAPPYTCTTYTVSVLHRHARVWVDCPVIKQVDAGLSSTIAISLVDVLPRFTASILFVVTTTRNSTINGPLPWNHSAVSQIVIDNSENVQLVNNTSSTVRLNWFL